MADDGAPSRLQQLPTWLLSQVSLRAHRMLADAFAQAGSRGYDYRLLAALSEYGPTSQIALGRRTGIDRSDVVAALDELTTKGFVRRRRDEQDLRRNVIAITAKGERHYERLDALVGGVQDELLAGLSAGSRARLVATLRQILAEDDSRDPA